MEIKVFKRLLFINLVSVILVLKTFGQTPLVYEVENTGANCRKPALLPLDQLKAYDRLPDPFAWADGHGRIKSFKDWKCRRAEIIAEIEHYEIGVKPPRPSNITADYSNGILTVTVVENGKTLTLTSKFSVPAGPGPFPAMIGMLRGTGSLPVNVFNSRNILQIPFNHDQVTKYSGKSESDPFFQLYPDLIGNGQYSAWAWGVSRLIDGLEIVQKKKQLNVDLRHIGVTGCSYAGKMALFAGALDERIALTIPQESGGGGGAAWRVSETLGKVETLGATNHSWFMESMFQFAGPNVAKLPFDHHELLALVAPRALLVLANGATTYVWLAEESGYVSSRACENVYRILGIPDRFGFSHSSHNHCMLPDEQLPELEAFVDKFLMGKETNTTGISKNPFPDTDYNKWISDWKDYALPSKK
jgi:hypothetical protein